MLRTKFVAFVDVGLAYRDGVHYYGNVLPVLVLFYFFEELDSVLAGQIDVEKNKMEFVREKLEINVVNHIAAADELKRDLYFFKSTSK
jgi:hypothetical protein